MSFTLQKHVSHLVVVVVGQLLYLSSLRVMQGSILWSFIELGFYL